MMAAAWLLVWHWSVSRAVPVYAENLCGIYLYRYIFVYRPVRPGPGARLVESRPVKSAGETANRARGFGQWDRSWCHGWWDRTRLIDWWDWARWLGWSGRARRLIGETRLGGGSAGETGSVGSTGEIGLGRSAGKTGPSGYWLGWWDQAITSPTHHVTMTMSMLSQWVTHHKCVILLLP